jgi:hypothetical protein
MLLLWPECTRQRDVCIATKPTKSDQCSSVSNQLWGMPTCHGLRLGHMLPPPSSLCLLCIALHVMSEPAHHINLLPDVLVVVSNAGGCCCGCLARVLRATLRAHHVRNGPVSGHSPGRCRAAGAHLCRAPVAGALAGAGEWTYVKPPTALQAATST